MSFADGDVMLGERPAGDAAAAPGAHGLPGSGSSGGGSPDAPHPWRRDLLVIAIFVVLGAVKLATHEMWRDELQAWMIARNSHGLGDLLRNLRYEGTPALWHLLLYGVSRLTAAPQAMQALHLVLATAAAAVVLRRAPFPYPVRVLFLFGYFPFFEYLNVSRQYVLGLLFLVVFCAVAWRPDRNWLTVGGALGLLALTSAYGVLLAVALAAALLVDQVRSRKRGDLFAGGARQAVAGTAVFAAALVAAVVQMRPPADSVVAGWDATALSDRVRPVLGQVWKALVPIPALDRPSWGLNIVAETPRSATAVAALGLLLFTLVALRARRDRPALCLWLSGTALLLGLSFVRYEGGLRHWGHLVLLLVAVGWLIESRPPRGPMAPLDRVTGRSDFRRLLVVVFVAQGVAALVATTYDLRHPFSNSRRAAEFIARQDYAGAVLVGDSDAATSPVGAWLDREMHYPQAGRTGTFIVWDAPRSCAPSRHCLSEEALVARALEALGPGDELALLVVDRPLADRVPVAAFTGSLVWGEENYYLYELRRGAGDQAGPAERR